MTSDLRYIALVELAASIRNAIAAGPFGSNLVSRDYVEQGVPVIRGQNLQGRWVGGEFVYVSEEKAQKLQSNTTRPGDVVFTQRGTLGQVSMVPATGESVYVISQSQMKITVDQEKADPRYVYYACTSSEFMSQIQNNAVAAGVPHINLGILRGLQIPLPSLSDQMGIAHVLSTLDDQIELLRETNSTLEAIAQAIFKSWFIDFDPVKAKSEGRTPDGIDAETAALFPDSFEESALGAIPKGWIVDEVGNVADCVGGGTPSTKEEAFWEPGTHHWVTPKDLSGLGSPVLLDTERKLSQLGIQKVSSGLLPKGTLLLSSRAPIGYLALAQIPLAVNQGFIAMKPGGRLPPEYLYFWTASAMDEIKQKANGSTFMEISKSAFRPIKVVVPDKRVVDAFKNLAGTIFETIEANEAERRTLTELRDALLPRLISGKLKLPELQEVAEAL